MSIRPSIPEARTTNRVMVVTGVSGCGKDFLIDRANDAGLIPNRVRVFNFGQELFRQAQVSYPELRTRDDLKTKLTGQQVRTEISGTINRVLEMQPALLNTHVVYQQDGGLVINPDVEEELQAGYYVCVMAEPADIVTWRSHDTSRRRLAETAAQIGLHQEIALGAVHNIARHIGAKTITLHNHPDHTDANLATMHDVLRAL